MYDARMVIIYTILLRKSIMDIFFEVFFCVTPWVFWWKRRFRGAVDFIPKLDFFRQWKIDVSDICQISGSNFTRACAVADHFSVTFWFPKWGRKVARGCTGSSKVAFGNFAFFRKVDFALAGTIKKYFRGEFASIRKTSIIDFKNLRSGTKNEVLWDGVRNRFFQKWCKWKTHVHYAL